MNDISILHCFSSYLPVTQNWAFRILKYLPACKQFVAARHFLECEFYLPHIKYLPSPCALPKGLKRLAILPKSVDFLIFKTYPLWLSWRLRKERICIIHSHFANTGWYYRSLANRLGALHVVSFYGLDYEHLPTIRPRWKARINRLFIDADLLICEGPHGAQILKSLGCQEEKIRVCPLGIDSDTVPYFHREKIPGELRLLQIAAFREKKGHIDTVKAFARALPSCPAARLTLIGGESGPILDAVRKLIIDEGLSDRVEILDFIKYSEIYDFMEGSQVFIHPSVHTPQNDCEGGAPVVLLDAQATGMPIISTLHCDIPEEVVDGETGLLAAEHDIDALTKAIQRFYFMDQTEYDKFSKRARLHVSSKFDLRACVERLRQVYAEFAEAT